MGNTNKGPPQLHVLLLGEKGVGISSLIWRLETNNFGTSISDQVVKKFKIDGQDVELVIYRILNFEDAPKRPLANIIQAVLYCYSPSDPSSIAAVEDLAKKFKANKEDHQEYALYPAAMLRMKSDVPAETDARPNIEGAKEVFEVSSKEGTNIIEPFEYIARRIWEMNNARRSANQKDK